VQRETFTEALRSAMKNGIITADDSATKENLRTMYGISSEDFFVIETRLIREQKQELQNR
jgi:hypothetical protein